MRIIWLFPDSHPDVEDRIETGTEAHAFEEFDGVSTRVEDRNGTKVQVVSKGTRHADVALCGVIRHGIEGKSWVNPNIPKDSHPKCPTCLEKSK